MLPPSPVTMPTTCWGAPDAVRRALLVHGLGSNGALMWRFGSALADAGWHACAVDLRGHGLAPRALDYRIAAYAADLAHARPRNDAGASWDLVVGHSLGGAASVVASADDPTWTRRLVLVDPALFLAGRDHAAIRASQVTSFAQTTTAEVQAANPRWHQQDVELKLASVQQASHWAVLATMDQNPDPSTHDPLDPYAPWDVRDAATRLTVPTHVLAGDPAVYTLFRDDLAEQVLQNSAITLSRVDGTGHSPHRDDGDATTDAFLELL